MDRAYDEMPTTARGIEGNQISRDRIPPAELLERQIESSAAVLKHAERMLIRLQEGVVYPIGDETKKELAVPQAPPRALGEMLVAIEEVSQINQRAHTVLEEIERLLF